MRILWDSPYVAVLWKLSLSICGSILRAEIGWDRVAYRALAAIAEFLETSLVAALMYA